MKELMIEFLEHYELHRETYKKWTKEQIINTWLKTTRHKIKKTDEKPKEIKEPPKAHLEIGYIVAQIFNRKDHFQAFMDFGEKAMKEYADYVLHNKIIDSNNICKCKPDETTGATTWWICNCCGRIQKDLK